MVNELFVPYARHCSFTRHNAKVGKLVLLFVWIERRSFRILKRSKKDQKFFDPFDTKKINNKKKKENAYHLNTSSLLDKLITTIKPSRNATAILSLIALKDMTVEVCVYTFDIRFDVVCINFTCIYISDIGVYI